MLLLACGPQVGESLSSRSVTLFACDHVSSDKTPPPTLWGLPTKPSAFDRLLFTRTRFETSNPGSSGELSTITIDCHLMLSTDDAWLMAHEALRERSDRSRGNSKAAIRVEEAHVKYGVAGSLAMAAIQVCAQQWPPRLEGYLESRWSRVLVCRTAELQARLRGFFPEDGRSEVLRRQVAVGAMRWDVGPSGWRATMITSGGEIEIEESRLLLGPTLETMAAMWEAGDIK